MDNLPDPKTLSDEELDKVLAGDEPVEEPDETPEPAEEADVAEPSEEAEEPEDEPEEEVEEEPKPPSRREQLRIQQVLEKLKQTDQPGKPTTNSGLNYRDELDADEEVVKTLEADRNQSRQEAFSEGLSQAKTIEWRTMLHVDSPQVEAEHPQLNSKDQEAFHPVIADAVNTWYLTMSGYNSDTETVKNPGVRYRDFVDGIFELAEEIASTKVQEARKNVAKQARQTGLRPDGSSAKRLNLNKVPEAMSDEELDAFLAKNVPKR